MNMPSGSARAYAEWERRWDGEEEDEEGDAWYEDEEPDDSHARREWADQVRDEEEERDAVATAQL